MLKMLGWMLPFFCLMNLVVGKSAVTGFKGLKIPDGFNEPLAKNSLYYYYS